MEQGILVLRQRLIARANARVGNLCRDCRRSCGRQQRRVRGAGVGVPRNRQTGSRHGYIARRRQEDSGIDVDRVLATITYMW